MLDAPGVAFYFLFLMLLNGQEAGGTRTHGPIPLYFVRWPTWVFARAPPEKLIQTASG